MSKLRLFIQICLIFLIVVMVITIVRGDKISEPRFLPNPSLFTQNTYHLAPLRKLPAFEYILYEPHVRTAPGESLYKLFHLRELLDLRTGRFSQVFFAAKRTEELERWGDSLSVERSNPDYLALSSRCKGAAYKWISNSCLNPTWESVLARYVSHMERFLDQAELIPSQEERLHALSESKAYLRQNESALISYLISSSLPDADKSYLTGLIRTIFNKLNMRVDPYSSEYSTHSLRYASSSLGASKDRGVYSLQVETTNLPDAYIKSMRVYYQEKEISQSKLEQISSHKMLRFAQFPIEKYDGIFRVDFAAPRKNLLQDAPWQYEKRTGERPHRYYISVPNFSSYASYLLHIKHNVSVGLNVSIQEFSGTAIGNQGIPVSVYINPQVENKSHDIFTKFFGTFPETTARVEIATVSPLSEEDLKKIQVELWEFYEPILHLTKIGSLSSSIPDVSVKKNDNNSYKVEMVNTNDLQDKALLDTISHNWTIDRLDSLDDSHKQVLTIIPRIFVWRYYFLTICILLLLYTLRDSVYLRPLEKKFIRVTLYILARAKHIMKHISAIVAKNVSQIRKLRAVFYKLRYLSIIGLLGLAALGYVQPLRLTTLFFIMISLLLYYFYSSFKKAQTIIFILATIMMLVCIILRVVDNTTFFRTSAVYAFILWSAVTIHATVEQLKR